MTKLFKTNMRLKPVKQFEPNPEFENYTFGYYSAMGQLQARRELRLKIQRDVQAEWLRIGIIR